MTVDLVMPKLGLTMTEGAISSWQITPGTRFAAGDVLLVVETEKIASDVEASEAGMLDEILAEAGDTVPCGVPIARWTPAQLGSGDAARRARSTSATDEALARDREHRDGFRPSPSANACEAPAVVQRVERRALSTPFARKLARELDVDLRTVTGTGPRGRIKAPDVRLAANESTCADRAVCAGEVARVESSYTDEPRSTTREGRSEPPFVNAPRSVGALPAMAGYGGQRRVATNLERTVAERLSRAKTVPHFYLSTEVDVAELERVRGALNTGGALRVSVTHLLLAALARTLVDIPAANRVWDDGHIVQFERVDLGLAVHTERGLVAPMVRGLGALRFSDLVTRCDEVVGRARAGTLTRDDLGGGASGLSNAGMHDVTYMSSIIAPGHASILGVGSVREVFRPDERGAAVLKRELGVVMSADHRIFDGVSALAVLARFKFYLAHPLHILT